MLRASGIFVLKNAGEHFIKARIVIPGSAQGYRMVSVDGRKVAEHIYIMEKLIGRKMKGRGKEVVHHIDGNKLNNAPRNLRLMSMPEHQSMHVLTRRTLIHHGLPGDRPKVSIPTREPPDSRATPKTGRTASGRFG